MSKKVIYGTVRDHVQLNAFGKLRVWVTHDDEDAYSSLDEAGGDAAQFTCLKKGDKVKLVKVGRGRWDIVKL